MTQKATSPIYHATATLNIVQMTQKKYVLNGRPQGVLNIVQMTQKTPKTPKFTAKFLNIVQMTQKF